MANSNGMTPRQKMINLMYIVLTAMLALNVSSDVLDGFTQVDEGLKRSNSNAAGRNGLIFAQLEAFAQKNPAKGKPWLDKAVQIRQYTDRLLSQVDSLKLAVVKQADGPQGDPSNIQHRDDLEASAAVMLNPATLQGQHLRQNIDQYRDYILQMLPDSTKRATVATALSTVGAKKQEKEGLRLMKWEEVNFESKPVVAAVTLLSKLENDIRYAEGEALHSLRNAVDAKDIRVNKLEAFVIPESRMLMRGGKYSAQIVLAAVDTTARPTVYIGGRQLNSKGVYEATAGSSGTFQYSGYLSVPGSDGQETKYPFSSSYTVFEPAATISPTMMNVLYAGIDNPISISAAGVPNSALSASMTNGTLTRSGDHWIARPAAVGKEAVITVTATIDGRSQTMGSMTFRTRKLPDPTPYIPTGTDHYRGGKPLAKATLLGANGVDAAIDDGLLNVKFNVVSFQTVFFDQMGNNIVENSDGGRFSERQKAQFRNLKRGKRFIITNVKASGPDGITRTISPLDVIVY